MGKLTAVKAQNAPPGKYGDGRGLQLHVRKNGTRAWVFRYMLNGKAREMGLGPLHTVSLAKAREIAADCRRQLVLGEDPINNRRQKRISAAGQMTFRDCAERFLEAHQNSWRNEKHRKQWASTLEAYAYPKIGDHPVNTVGTAEVMRVLDPIWRTKTETAKRLRGRVERILDWARVREYREGENPARWRGHLDNLLPAPSRIAKVNHHPALAFTEVPEFMATLRGRTGVAARALEFLILTAARSGEVRHMTWDEVDGDTWIVPAERMKNQREHRVPLTERALDILKEMAEHGDKGLVFKSLHRAGKPLSDMTLLAVLKRMKRDDLTVHGFRSTFRDWIGERTEFSSDVAEKALAHTIGDEVRKAYQRGDLFDKRRKLMDMWAAYCCSPTKVEVAAFATGGGRGQ